MRQVTYRSVRSFLQEKGHWAELRLLEGEQPRSCAVTLWSLFCRAAEDGDDESSVRMFTWLMHATDDIYFLPLLGENDVLPHSEEVNAAKDAASKARSLEAMGSWRVLPTTEVQADYPALLKTKKYLLTEIVGRWRQTEDEEEADQLFDFLIGLKLNSVKERDIFQTVVRENGTNTGFPPARAARHYLNLTRQCSLELLRRNYGPDSHLSEFAKMLSIAWIRNSTYDQRARAMLVAMPVHDSSDEAAEALGEISQFIAEVAVAVEVLKKQVKLQYSAVGPKLSARYSVSGSHNVELTVEFPSRWNNLNSYLMNSKRWQFDENKAHDKFDELVELVQKWREEHSDHAIRLVMLARHNDDQDLVYQRERMIK